MDSKYKFDLIYLKNTSKKLSQMLKNSKLSKLEKYNIKSDIMTLNDLISISKNKTSLFEDNSSKCVSEIKSGKEMLFDIMKNEYNYFGENIIRFIIELGDSNILDFDFSDVLFFNNNMDELIFKTQELYSTYSNDLYNKVKNMFKKNSILEVKCADYSSFVSYVNYLKKCFFVIDITYAPYVLSHEAFHGITATNDINSLLLYEELGPILFETLYIDKLYDEKNPDIGKQYYIRIDDCLEILDDLVDYFKLLLKFKEKNFMVNDSEFCDIIQNTIPIYKTDDALIDYLNDYALDYKANELGYIVSFIKSLELREIIKNDKKRGIDCLFKILNSSNYNMNNSVETFECTKRYIKEIKSKL